MPWKVTFGNENNLDGEKILSTLAITSMWLPSKHNETREISIEVTSIEVHRRDEISFIKQDPRFLIWISFKKLIFNLIFKSILQMLFTNHTFTMLHSTSTPLALPTFSLNAEGVFSLLTMS